VVGDVRRAHTRHQSENHMSTAVRILDYSTRHGVSLFGAAVLMLTACGSPPDAQLDSADEAMTAAADVGASEYAPEIMGAATEAQTALEAELAAQQGKFGLLRSYDHAAELADSVRVIATRASEQAAQAREQARVDTQTLLTEVKTELTEVLALWEEAPSGKGSAADLAALRGDLDGVAVAVTEAETSFAAGNYLEARSRASSARETTASVRTALGSAIQTPRRSG
jgi:hypothetical protein